jgi:hypothetical protein
MVEGNAKSIEDLFYAMKVRGFSGAFNAKAKQFFKQKCNQNSIFS